MANPEAPSPSPSNAPFSLPEQINIATRSIHTVLNRSILSRLPLALPPHTTTPSIYVSGILHIAPIYITFESLWQTIIDTPHLSTCESERSETRPCRHRAPSCIDGGDPAAPLLDSNSLPIVPILPSTDASTLFHCPAVCSRTHSILTHLRLPGLLRAGRLKADIRTLTGTPDHQIDESIDAISDNGRLAAFIAHTKKSVERNPHVLLAYAWVLYMAIFSGGRYIRAALQAAAGPEGSFWLRDSSPVRPYSITTMSKERRPSSMSDSFDPLEAPRSRSSTRSEVRSRISAESTSKNTSGFQFFHFSGDEDGEDIKREFKRRLTEAETLLTIGEREDIVTEAQEIFKFMVEMVSELDDVCGTRPEALSKKAGDSRTLISSRDSVQLTQERFDKMKEASDPPTAKTSRQMSPPQQQPYTQESSEDSVEANNEELRGDLGGLLGCPSPKLVRFNESPPSARLFFLGQGIFWITKPLGRRFSAHGFARNRSARNRSEVSVWDLGVVLLTTLASSVLVVAFMAWYYKNDIGDRGIPA